MVQFIEITLQPKSRGIHLITSDIAKQLDQKGISGNGLVNIFIKHTSAGLCINENADSSVRVDLETFFNRLVPENAPYYTHTQEGSDDMPAHIKSVLTGNSLTIPFVEGRLALGTWQGIYLCEFRNHASSRKLIVTFYT